MITVICKQCQLEFTAEPENGTQLAEQYIECPHCGAEFVVRRGKDPVLDEFDEEEDERGFLDDELLVRKKEV